MSDDGKKMQREESFIDSLSNFFGFGDKNEPQNDSPPNSENGSDSENSAKKGGKRRKKRRRGAKKNTEQEGSERDGDGADALGRRKSVWDSMREMVVGDEENGENNNGEAEYYYEDEEGKIDLDRTVLVTGAEGYIAGWVIKLLLEKGLHVIGTVRTLRNKPKHEHLLKLAAEIGGTGSGNNSGSGSGNNSGSGSGGGNGATLELVEADLMRPMSFDRAVAKCGYVIHVASPFKLGVRDATIGLINPAVQGTLNVLRSCAKAGTVKRVVVTSCAVAMVGKPVEGKEYSEADWNTSCSLENFPYSSAKTEAEKAAYDFVKKLPGGEKLSLVTLCPSFVIGPMLNGATGTLNTSLRVMQDVMKANVPFVPKMGLPLVDVRDVANAHFLAAVNPDATGRYAVHCDTMAFSAVVNVMRGAYKRGNFPAKEKSKFFVRRNEVFIRNMPFQYIRPWLGRSPLIANRKIRKDLGIEFRPVEKSIIDMCESFDAWGV